MTQTQTNGAAVLEQAQQSSDLGRMLDKPINRGTIDIENGQLVPKDFEGIHRMAKWLMATNVVPKWVQTEAQCMLSLSYGMSVGLTALNSLRWVMVVNGAPTIWGDAAIAVVRRFDKCAGISERIDGDGDNMVAHCEARRWIIAPDKSFTIENVTRSFSVADAKKAGLWGKTGPWSQHPKRMLQMRARGFALRDLFPDVLGGMYLAEEVEAENGDKAAELDAKIGALSQPDSWSTQTFINPQPVEVVNVETGEVTQEPSDDGKAFLESLVPQDEPKTKKK